MKYSDQNSGWKIRWLCLKVGLYGIASGWGLLNEADEQGQEQINYRTETGCENLQK